MTPGSKQRGVIVEVVSTIGMFVTCWIVIVGGLVFLDRAFLDPNLAAIPEQQQGLIVGAITTLMGSALSGVLGLVAMRAGSRQAQDAAKAGVDAALAPPPPASPAPATGQPAAPAVAGVVVEAPGPSEE